MPVVPPEPVVAVPVPVVPPVPVVAVPPVPVVPPDPVVAVPPLPVVPPDPVLAVPVAVVPLEPVVPVPPETVVPVVPPEADVAADGALVIVFIIAGLKLNVCVRSLMFIAIGCSLTTPVIIGSAVGLIVVVVFCLFIKLYMPNKASI